MNACIMTDIEGVAGVNEHVEQSYPTGKYFEQAKALLTAEVNAAVEGLVSAGVEDVLVLDGHGPGAIVFEQLHAKARLLHGRPITYAQLVMPIWDYDALLFVGQHARHGIADGNQNHTFNSRSIDWMKLNGKLVGEIACVSLFAAERGVPTIFLSGDEAGCREAQADIPGIHTVAVKRGIAKNVAISLSAVEARRQIREGVREALRRHSVDPVHPPHMDGPYTKDIRYFTTSDADAAESKGAQRLDSQTVRYQSPSLIDVLMERPTWPPPREEQR